jgi:hypothetical protein
MMIAAGVADSGEAAQPVTDDGAGGLEIVLRQAGDFGLAEAVHAAQLQADWLTLRCRFDRDHDRRLARRTSATLAAVPLAAEIGVVDFDPSGQTLCVVPLHHHLHELVLDSSGAERPSPPSAKPPNSAGSSTPPTAQATGYKLANDGVDTRALQ